MENVEEEQFIPYHGTVYVAYFPEGKVDKGPMATYEFEGFLLKMDKPLGRTDEIPFRFYFYFGTSFNKTCIHLKQNDRTDAQSRLVELMNEGAVCYRKVNT